MKDLNYPMPALLIAGAELTWCGLVGLVMSDKEWIELYALGVVAGIFLMIVGILFCKHYYQQDQQAIRRKGDGER